MSATIADLSNTDFALGCQASPFQCEQDLAISTNLFQQFPQSVYILELRATNGQAATGTSQLSFYVNEAPTSGTCSLAMNGTSQRLIDIVVNGCIISIIFSSFTSLIDSVEFSCMDWVDPENIGLSSYVLFATDLLTNVTNGNFVEILSIQF